jgi:hypothetical protein
VTASVFQPEAETLQVRHHSVMRPIVDPARTMARIRVRIVESAPEEAQLRILLVLAHELLRRREEEATNEPPSPVPAEHAPWTPQTRAVAVQEYSELVPRIRELAASFVPPGSNVLVTSRGDDALLDLPGLRGAHFPQGQGGGWAGFYPADSASAIAHLEALRMQGAEFILFPGPAYWWFEYYDELSRHLLTRSRVVHHDNDCAIFELRGGEGRVSA